MCRGTLYNSSNGCGVVRLQKYILLVGKLPRISFQLWYYLAHFFLPWENREENRRTGPNIYFIHISTNSKIFFFSCQLFFFYFFLSSFCFAFIHGCHFMQGQMLNRKYSRIFLSYSHLCRYYYFSLYTTISALAYLLLVYSIGAHTRKKREGKKKPKV